MLSHPIPAVIGLAIATISGCIGLGCIIANMVRKSGEDSWDERTYGDWPSDPGRGG